MKDLEKSISMKCSVCGNDQFSTLDESIEEMLNASDETEVKCSDCGRVTTKAQLIEDNSYLIDANIKDFQDDVVKQLQKDLKRMFK